MGSLKHLIARSLPERCPFRCRRAPVEEIVGRAATSIAVPGATGTTAAGRIADHATAGSIVAHAIVAHVRKSKSANATPGAARLRAFSCKRSERGEQRQFAVQPGVVRR